MADIKEELRIVIRARVTDIPGPPRSRYITLADLFAAKVLRRNYQHAITSKGYDGVIIPPDFDSEKPVNRWFVYDLNVTGEKTREELLTLPHKVYLACKQGDSDW
jgi:hypothetical protein